MIDGVTTARLVLRPARPDDVADLFSYHRLPEVCRYLPFNALDEDGMAERLATYLATDVPADTEPHTHTLVAEHEQRVIGHVMMRQYPPVPRTLVEVGWVFHPDVAGQGFATEAAAAVVDLAFERFPTHRVFAQLDARNDASARLCERVGLLREGHLRQNYHASGEWSDTLYFGLLREEWETQRPLSL